LCRIEYDSTAGGNPLPEGTSSLLAVYNITGIAEFAEENSGKGLGAPKVHLSFALDSSGVVTLSKAEATLELPPDKEEEAEEAAAAAAANATASANETTAASPDAAAEAAAPPADSPDAAGSNATAEAGADPAAKADGKKDAKKENSKKKAAEKKKAKKDRTLRRVLTVRESLSSLSPPVWTIAQISESRSKLRALDAADQARREREAALNDLEGYIYKVRNRLEDEASALKEVSTAEQRTEVEELCSAASLWLEDESANAGVKDFKAKQATVSKPAEAIFSRFSETTKRPEAVKKAQTLLAAARKAVDGWNETHPQITDAEKETFLAAVTVAEEWITSNEEKQAATKPHEEPAFHSKEIKPITDGVAAKMQALLKKPKPKPVPVAKEVRASSLSLNTVHPSRSFSLSLSLSRSLLVAASPHHLPLPLPTNTDQHDGQRNLRGGGLQLH
jgi:hypoxia up-regulated 1